MKARAGFLAVRLGLALVFLWFGIDKFVEPAAWVGWIPAPLYALLGDSGPWWMYGLGLVETAIGLALATGFGLRAGGWAASAVLAGIILGVGLNWTATRPVIVRDLGLLGAALSVALRERGHDEPRRRRKA